MRMKFACLNQTKCSQNSVGYSVHKYAIYSVNQVFIFSNASIQHALSYLCSKLLVVIVTSNCELIPYYALIHVAFEQLPSVK